MPFDELPGLSANRDGKSSWTIAGTVQTNPPILSPIAHSTSRRHQDDSLPSRLSKLNRFIAAIGVRVVEKAFPQETSKLQAEHHRVVNAPLIGSAQINMSPINTDLKDDLGYAGVCHTDPNDESFSLSVILCVSHLPDLPSTNPWGVLLWRDERVVPFETFLNFYFSRDRPSWRNSGYSGCKGLRRGEVLAHQCYSLSES